MAARLSDDELMVALRAVPQRIVGRMCGSRQTIHLQRVSDRWGFPIDGKTVDMFAVMARLWSFLKQYGPMLSALMEDTGEGDEGALGVQFLRAKIRKATADASAAELRNAQKEGHLCDRATVHAIFEIIASMFQNAARQAQLKWGENGYDFFVTLADKLEVEFTKVLAADAPNGGGTDPQVTEADTSKPSDLA